MSVLTAFPLGNALLLVFFLGVFLGGFFGVLYGRFSRAPEWWKGSK